MLGLQRRASDALHSSQSNPILRSMNLTLPCDWSAPLLGGYRSSLKLIRSAGARVGIQMYGKVEYLHGIVQLLGLVTVWRVHEGHDESLKFAAQL